jgi:hypothetical protein
MTSHYQGKCPLEWRKTIGSKQFQIHIISAFVFLLADALKRVLSFAVRPGTDAQVYEGIRLPRSFALVSE